MADAGRKIIEGLKEAVAGDFASVTIDGQRWVRDDDWQPIETAPKDGTMIAVHSWIALPRRRLRFLSLAHWASGEVGDLAPDWRDENGTRVGVGEDDEEWLWRPLPTPRPRPSPPPDTGG